MIPVGSDVAVRLSLSFNVNVATPSLNVMSPYVPLIDVSLNVTVKWKSLFVSPLFPLTSFDTMRLPVGSFLFSSVIVTIFVCPSYDIIGSDSPIYSYPSTTISLIVSGQ